MKEICNHREDCPFWDSDYVSCNNCKYRVEKLQEQVNQLKQEKSQLEQALDNACLKITENNDCPFSQIDWCPIQEDIECKGNELECWKEWCMKEVDDDQFINL